MSTMTMLLCFRKRISKSELSKWTTRGRALMLKNSPLLTDNDASAKYLKISCCFQSSVIYQTTAENHQQTIIVKASQTRWKGKKIIKEIRIWVTFQVGYFFAAREITKHLTFKFTISSWETTSVAIRKPSGYITNITGCTVWSQLQWYFAIMRAVKVGDRQFVLEAERRRYVQRNRFQTLNRRRCPRKILREAFGSSGRREQHRSYVVFVLQRQDQFVALWCFHPKDFLTD